MLHTSIATNGVSDAAKAELKSTTVVRLDEGGSWYGMWANYAGADARGCLHAVTVRDRLGSGEHGGVPLWTELKSEIGILTSRSTSERFFYATHTRANTRIDSTKLAELFGIAADDAQFAVRIDAAIEPTTEPETKSDSEIFGLVNPLNIDVLFRLLGQEKDRAAIHQIFDLSVLLEAGHPNTMTTNAGDRAMAFEINPSDLIRTVSEYFPNTTVRDIARPDPIWLGKEGNFVKQYWLRFPPPIGPKIGILTGNSPESGLTLWRDILILFRDIYRNTADVLMPEIVVHSVPAMGLSMELVKRESAVWAAVEPAIKSLLDSGCKLLTVACNTTIYFEPRINHLCASYSANFVPIAEACIPSIRAALNGHDGHPDRVGLVGIGPVVDIEGDYSGYARHLKEHGIDVVPCDGTKLAYLMKSIGMDKAEKQKAVTAFERLMRTELASTRVVVLALTEISLAYRLHIQARPKTHHQHKVIIDPLYELARYLVHKYLADGLRHSAVCQIPADFDLDDGLLQLVYSRP